MNGKRVREKTFDHAAEPRRFAIAVSFPGEHRRFVKNVVKRLAEVLGPDRVFFDEWYESELVGLDGDLKLRRYYREQSEVVVPFFSEHYEKDWCQIEWSAIRAMLKARRKEDAVIPVQLDGTRVPGWEDIDFPIRRNKRTGRQIADLILEAYRHRHPDGSNTREAATEKTGSPDWERSTQQAKNAIAAEAQKVLNSHCDPYIPSSLSEEVADAGLTAKERQRPLDQDAYRQVVLGRLPEEANRVRLLADSGLGKSMFLCYCEREIAAAQDGRLPVRLTNLSQFNWKDKPEDVLEALADKRLAEVLPHPVDDEGRRDWLKWLVRQHRVVFLLDSLDQTNDQLLGLSSFLSSRGAGVSGCPVLMTGRPETLRTRSTVFHGQDWRTLRVDPFDEHRQRTFLGEVLAEQLVLKEDERLSINEIVERHKVAKVAGEDVDSDATLELFRRRLNNTEWQAEIARKWQWDDLLEVPLLLHLIRDLASREELEDLANREALYERSIHHLVEQGWDTWKQTDSRADLMDAEEVWDHLIEIAWRTLCADRNQTDFRGVLDGHNFRKLRKEYDKDLLEALHQIDLTTAHSIVEQPRQAGGLAWRHLSFAEYFGGLKLLHIEASLAAGFSGKLSLAGDTGRFPHEPPSSDLRRDGPAPVVHVYISCSTHCANSRIVPGTSSECAAHFQREALTVTHKFSSMTPLQAQRQLAQPDDRQWQGKISHFRSALECRNVCRTPTKSHEGGWPAERRPA